MNRRDLFRKALWGTAAAFSQGIAPAREFPADRDASQDLARADWKPQFFDAHQDATLVAFADVLIPETDTPGAKAALVNRFLDRLLAAETRENQRDFLSSLAFLDGEATARYRAAFVDLTPDRQVDIVTLMAYGEQTHFARLKDWISRSFYNSEAGMRTLGYTGVPGGVLPDCK